MDIEKIKSLISKKVKKIDSIKFPDKDSWRVDSDSKLKETIEKEIKALKLLVSEIKAFNSVELSKDEKILLEYVDDKGVFKASRVDIVENIIEHLKNYQNPATLANPIIANPIIVNDRTEKKFFEEQLKQIFNYELIKPNDRIYDFLNGKLNEEMAWQDGIILKLNTENHLNTVANLNTEINQILRIFRAFGRLNNNNESDFKIYKIETGSLLLTILTVAGVVITLGKAANQILDVIKKVYEIKQHVIGLKKIKSESLKEVIQALEKQSTIDEENSNEIADNIIAELKYKEDDINEVRTFLSKAISYMFKFYDDGGELILLLEPVAMKDKANLELRKSIKIKYLEFIKEQEQLKILLSRKDWKILKMKYDNNNTSH